MAEKMIEKRYIGMRLVQIGGLAVVSLHFAVMLLALIGFLLTGFEELAIESPQIFVPLFLIICLVPALPAFIALLRNEKKDKKPVLFSLLGIIGAGAAGFVTWQLVQTCMGNMFLSDTLFGTILSLPEDDRLSSLLTALEDWTNELNPVQFGLTGSYFLIFAGYVLILIGGILSGAKVRPAKMKREPDKISPLPDSSPETEIISANTIREEYDEESGNESVADMPQDAAGVQIIKVQCPKCLREYGQTARFCPFCGLKNGNRD